MDTLAFLAIGAALFFFVWTEVWIKVVVEKLPRAKSLSLQYLIVASVVWVVALSLGAVEFELVLLVVLAIGFVNALGAYAEWRALDYNLSKTSLFFPLQHVHASVLTALFLNEALLYKSFWLFVGIALAFIAAFLLARRGKRGSEQTGLKWLFAVVAMVGIFGATGFSVKYFASSGMPELSFLRFWYAGALLGSLPILWYERKDKRPLFQRDIWKVFVVVVGVLGFMATQFFALQFVPGVVVFPIFAFGTVLLSILAGWWIFHERKGLSKTELLGFVIGGVGIAVIIISQQLAIRGVL